ncbi:MAG TPA: radical SAM protein [Elusimicrobiales bacterium]|nr:radical SAM protein [Elusimicrobiales bacterium]
MSKALARSAARRLRLVPSSLDVYMTDACNMRCSYCASARFIEKGGARTLPLARLLRGVDAFASLVAPRPGADDPASVREVSYTGGEPLLRWELLERAVKAVKKKYPWLKQTVFTNGTLLTPAKADLLLRAGARIVVSLDGGRAVNDRHRRLADGRPGFAAVAANLRRLSSAQRAGVHLMATFTSATAGALTETVRYFRTLGCRDIHLGLDLYEDWSPRALARLRTALAELREYCLRDGPAGDGPGPATGRGPGGDWDFNFYFKDRVAACLDLTPSNSFTLSPDGFFYPCDELCISAADPAKYAVGGAETGLDLGRLERVYSAVERRVKGLDQVNGVLSPIDRYFRAVLDGRDPAASLLAGGRVTRVFMEELGGLVEVERLFKMLARAPGFGDLSHRPRHALRAEGRRARLAAPASPAALAAARAAADLVLYSPGKRKELVLRSEGAFGDAARGLALYAALKGSRLGRRTRVALEVGP